MISHLIYVRGLLSIAAISISLSSVHARDRWSPETANAWYAKRGWRIGCNFTPSTASNQLEMWQAETFDPETIDRELGWAADLGFNSVRVFLHHLLWEQDREGFLARIEKFLTIADKHHIGVMLVPLDGVWDPHPKLGPQPEPVPRRHNSRWVQSPGAELLGDPKRHGELEPYIYGLVHHFKDDRRIDAWDLFNEPDNSNHNSYGTGGTKAELPNKAEMATRLLAKVFDWARKAEPSQPLTAGVWMGSWADHEKMSAIDKLMVEQSDVISFHNYGNVQGVRERIEQLRRYGRPILCTEYMARPAGSRFDPHLQVFKETNVGAYCWGLVDGRSQTIYPWDSWQKTYTAAPPVWFHDIFHRDGTPYDAAEVKYIRSVTGKK